MTDKCKLPTCENKLVHTEGRRPKEFCSPKCRTLFHNLKKVKGGGRGRPKGSKNKFKPNVIDIVEAEKRNNPLTNAARGRDESGVNEDEFDFSNDRFLDIEKHTKYPKKDRPTNKGEAITWDNLKKEFDQKIKEAWAKRKIPQ